MSPRLVRPPASPIQAEPIAATLAKHPLFAVLPKGALEGLAAVTRRREYPKGHHPYQVGDPATGVFLLISGMVVLTEVDGSGQEHAAMLFLPGDVIGLSTALLKVPRKRTVTALVDTVAYFIPIEPLDALYPRFPELARQIILALCEKVERTEETAVRFTLNPIAARIAAFLLEYASEDADPCGGGPVVHLPISYQDLALLLGTTRETINREFTRLARSGTITTREQEVVILRPEVLRGIAEAQCLPRST